MVRGLKHAGMAATLVAFALTASACSRVRGHQGFIADETLISAIQPGVDNRESVQKTLGRPSFVSQFGEQDWVYFSRQTRQLLFAQPRAAEQAVLRVRFDAAGNVAAVERTGLEKIASINPSSKKTPTLGKERGFFEDLFGNIGQVGSVTQGAGTADNPN
jgi:outer membrane protein assembly factor BamE (lipoprotein component of BamABCDE complex)